MQAGGGRLVEAVEASPGRQADASTDNVHNGLLFNCCEPHPDTGNVVILTIAHVFDKRPEVANLLNLPALCQRCHLNWDRKEHKFNRIRNRMARPIHHGQIPLCLPPEDSLAMLVYDQLVRRGEVSMPPQRVDAAGLRSRVLRVDRSALRMTHSCRRCWRCRCDCRR